jgi:hypothetical protein
MHKPQEADLVKAAWSEFGPEITKMWKRLRKKGARFRYLIVCELHKDRTPHFHVNLYEDGAKVTWRQLSAEWPHGHSQFALVRSERNAAYAAQGERAPVPSTGANDPPKTRDGPRRRRRGVRNLGA